MLARERAGIGLLSLAALVAACVEPERGSATNNPGSLEQAVSADPGAIIRMDMASSVGVLLDEIPAGSLRDAAASEALAMADALWIQRAARQAKLTYYRLVFRSGYYPTHPGKGPLPLPPGQVWNIDLIRAPRRAQIGGHDLVLVDYLFSTYIVSDAASPGTVEPKLAKVGGSWDEPFLLPADPELILQRTGYACMDEFEYPRGSVFEENTYYFYDQTCVVETPATSACHVTQFPTESCRDAVLNHVGLITTNMHFTRVPYDAVLAGQYRAGALVNPTGADLAVLQEDMVNEHRIFYRYFTSSSCDIIEGSIGSPGWRRLLAFSAVVRNDGTQPIHIGNVTDPTNPWVTSHVFEFSLCHNHYHFSHYGKFDYNGSPGSKRAFCLEDTNRFHNDERTPLTAFHQSCAFQGIGAGWGDEYQFGLPGQWVDITDVDTSTPHDLMFESNPDQFLCEGATLGSNNQPVDPLNLSALVFDPTTFVDSQGRTVSRIRCNFPSTWHDNNVGRVSVVSPSGSFVTDPCTRGQIGALRDCGFAPKPPLASCAPGASVHLTCRSHGPQQVLRICESSEKLGVGVACTFRDSMANARIDPNGTAVSFTCPPVRDAATAGTGGYSAYQAPLIPSQGSAPITCTRM